MKIGVSTSCLYPLETEKALLGVAKAGIKTTEIFFNANCELEKDFVAGLKKTKDEYGIEIVSVHPTMSLAESFMFFSNYQRRYVEGMDFYKRYAEIAGELGAKYIIMHGGKPNRVLDNRGYFERFAHIAEAVRKNGAVLLQENVVKFRAGDIGVLADMKEYLGDSAAFCLDIKQCVRGGYSPFSALGILKDSVKHIHISDNTEDNDCMLPLSGNFDFSAFFELCERVNYKGDAIVEVYRDSYEKPEELYTAYRNFSKYVMLQ
ncbi:MAG: sugar phosphate isomerase/epimerase [Clostridia bacterium]|nr:sugar phosphate isomerase/epimerase [Clostridia bacterium]